jgi:3-dehydroquinate synthase
MLDLRLGRDSCVIALGGGVTGDLAGFVAATYMRGVPLLQVPTTLLAMIDASIGGKTGIDTPAGKNLVGAFHPPCLVVADPELLRSLPATEVRSGMAEAIKHGAILDAGYLAWIEAHAATLLGGDHADLEHLVRRSVELKAAIVAEDPREHGRRAILNFGHTVGHALERLSRYALPHGPAVAAGMVVEAVAGEVLGITEAGTGARIAAILERCGLPARVLPELSAPQILGAMETDKKARRGTARCVLLRMLGECAPADREAGTGWTHELPAAALERALRAATGDV